MDRATADALLLQRKQAPSHPKQVSEGEQGIHLRQVLSDALVAHLRVAPQHLDDVERMLDEWL